MPIYMTAQYQVYSNKVNRTKDSIRQLVQHVKLHEPLTTIYIAQQQILNPSKFMHILRFEDELALKVHQSSPASANFVQSVYPETLQPIDFMEYNLIATVNS
jgi:quinol monooxygenase YgiN